MNDAKRKHNTPIATLIKNYTNKGSGKVCSSRKEIIKRFFGVDWRHQKQILFAFLQSGSSDREWAYMKLFSCWDDCFIPTLQELWEKHQEIPLSWLVIRFFPKEYVMTHLEELSVGRNYFFICKRLVNDWDFVLDKTRLNEADLLYVRKMIGETVTENDVIDLFFLLMYKLCRGVYGIRMGKIVDYTCGKPLISLFDNRIVVEMMLEIENEYRVFDLANDLQGWMWTVSEDYMKEHKANGDDDYIGHLFDEFSSEMIKKRMKDTCYKHIPPRYTDIWDTYDISDQQRFLDDLEERRKKRLQTDEREKIRRKVQDGLLNQPVSRSLIDTFNLEINDSLLF